MKRRKEILVKLDTLDAGRINLFNFNHEDAQVMKKTMKVKKQN